MCMCVKFGVFKNNMILWMIVNSYYYQIFSLHFLLIYTDGKADIIYNHNSIDIDDKKQGHSETLNRFTIFL